MTEYIQTVENDVLQAVKESVNGVTVHRYYGAINAPELASFIAGKLTAGVPAVMIGAPALRFERRDTMGDAYNGIIEVQIICASNILKDKELPNSERFTDRILTEVIKAMKGRSVVLDEFEYHYELQSIGNVFRVENMDAKQVTYELPGIYIEA